MKSLSLYGHPSIFPFDLFYFNLFYVFPVKFSLIQDDIFCTTFPLFAVFRASGCDFSDILIDKLVRVSWDLSNSNISVIAPENLKSEFPTNSTNPFYLPLSRFKGYETENVEDFTFLKVNFEIKRNYAIAVIIIPLVAIFYLLGAIFIFENNIDNIGNRLALTLGIFALIFTLPGIINSMKPQTFGPTIADSMLSTILIASIAFTVSSVISSSSVIRKWFPKHHTWIDGIVFLIVSGLVVAYFSNYPIDIIIWLIPIIIFRLGYGLLLRILGVKITKPIFARRKKTTYQKYRNLQFKSNSNICNISPVSPNPRKI